jgi:hypothetical protein
MAAVASEPKAAPAADLAAAIGDEDAAVADVLALVGESALARAWAAGDVEFGRAAHCVTGRPGVPESKPTLVVEGGTDWSGPKTPRHDRLARVLADLGRVPEVPEYKRYVKQVLAGKTEDGIERWRPLAAGEAEDGQEVRWTTTRINRDEAVRLMAPRVRLTDKGLAAARGE